MYFKSVVYTILSVIIIGACSSGNDKRMQYALEQAGKNRTQLEQVLEYYKDSALKYKAACYLIGNMPYYYSYEGALIDSVKAALARTWNFKDFISPDELKYEWRNFDYRGKKNL